MASVDRNKFYNEVQRRAWAQAQQRGPHVWGVRLHLSERKLLLAAVDFALLSGALLLTLRLSTGLIPQNILQLPVKWFASLAVVWVSVATVLDLYNLARAASPRDIFRAALLGAALASLLYLVVPYFTPPLLKRSQIFLLLTFSMTSIPAWRLLYAYLFNQPAFQRQALIVGAGSSGQALAHLLQAAQARGDANPFRGTGYVLLGFIEDDPAYWQQTAVGLPVWGNSQDLVRLVRALHIDEVIVAVTHTRDLRPELFEAVLDCRELGIPVTTMPTVYERLTGRVAADFAGRNVETATGVEVGAFVHLYWAFKRLADVAGGLAGLLLLLWVMPLVALGNRFWNPGPLLFRQQRVGVGGRPFVVIKLRSMIPDAEKESGAVWASSSDSRVTSLGNFLRKTHLDELPQVINVLRGEMSLVGPRPERPEFVGELSRLIPFYRARHCVRPGITGWAQIHQDYGDSVAGAREKLEYDLYYVKHSSITLDLIILLRTVNKVLGLRGR